MIDWEYGPPYEHSELDLIGKWDSSDSASIAFPLAREEEQAERPINYSRRSSLLIQRLEKVFFSVSVELKTVFEIPVANEFKNPGINPSEMYLEEPTVGIMLVEVSELRPGAVEPMEWCLAMAAETFGELMYERSSV